MLLSMVLGAIATVAYATVVSRDYHADRSSPRQPDPPRPPACHRRRSRAAVLASLAVVAVAVIDRAASRCGCLRLLPTAAGEAGGTRGVPRPRGRRRRGRAGGHAARPAVPRDHRGRRRRRRARGGHPSQLAPDRRQHLADAGGAGPAGASSSRCLGSLLAQLLGVVVSDTIGAQLGIGDDHRRAHRGRPVASCSRPCRSWSRRCSTSTCGCAVMAGTCPAATPVDGPQPGRTADAGSPRAAGRSAAGVAQRSNSRSRTAPSASGRRCRRGVELPSGSIDGGGGAAGLQRERPFSARRPYPNDRAAKPRKPASSANSDLRAAGLDACWTSAHSLPGRASPARHATVIASDMAAREHRGRQHTTREQAPPRRASDASCRARCGATGPVGTCHRRRGRGRDHRPVRAVSSPWSAPAGAGRAGVASRRQRSCAQRPMSNRPRTLTGAWATCDSAGPAGVVQATKPNG